MIKKFYEAAAEGQTSMPTAEATQQQAQHPQPLSVAAMMAKEGKIADTSTVRNYEPVVIKPGDEKPPTTEPPATEPVAAEPKVEEKSDSPTPPTEPVNPPIATEEPVKTVTWQEQLKTAQVQPDEVLKEIGFAPETIGFVKELKDGLDPKMVAFFNVWKSGGDVAGYLKEMTVDYGKMNPEQLMRYKLREDYPTVSDTALNKLYEAQVISKYNLDSEDETEREVGQELLSADAEKERSKFIQRQQEKLLPKAPEAKPDTSKEDAIKAEQQRVQEFIESSKNTVKEDALTKSIFANKAYTFGEGEDKFTYPVDPEKVATTIYDANQWDSIIWKNENGKVVPNVQNQVLVNLIGNYGSDFLQKLADHYKSIGSKSAIAPLENASPTTPQMVRTAAEPPKNAAEAMARGGMRISGGYQ